MKFISKNIKCSKCENLIKSSLEDDFGEIKIYPNDENTKIVEVQVQNEESFKQELEALGFEVVEVKND